MSKLAKLACATALGFGMSVGSASAAESTANLGVSAVVLDSCTVTALTALGFGDLDTNAAANELVPGSIQVVCTSSKTGASVKLGAGGSASGGTRQMSDSSSGRVPYSIFSDSAHTSSVAIDADIWSGDLTAVTPVNIPVYGQIPAGNYTTGIYTDTVLVTLTY